MERTYYKWHSPALGQEMELLVFGHAGERVLVFPTRGGRFFDYENWGMVAASSKRIEEGELQLFCVDSVDQQSLYAEDIPPAERIERHIAYEAYILLEVVPLSEAKNPSPGMVAHGCSLGAYHAVNIALRHPQQFSRIVALSGRYDLTQPAGPFRDLFDGFYNDNVYFHNPSHFIPNMWDEAILHYLRRLKIVLVIGEEDAFYDNNVEFSEALNRIGVPHILDVWEGEAHRPRYWRPMIAQYL